VPDHAQAAIAVLEERPDDAEPSRAVRHQHPGPSLAVVATEAHEPAPVDHEPGGHVARTVAAARLPDPVVPLADDGVAELQVAQVRLERQIPQLDRAGRVAREHGGARRGVEGPAAGAVRSSWRREAPSSSTRSASCRSRFSRASCACWRTARYAASEATTTSSWTSA